MAQRLARWYEQRERMRRRLVSGGMYPLLVVVLAILIMPLPALASPEVDNTTVLLGMGLQLAVVIVLARRLYGLFGQDRLHTLGPFHLRLAERRQRRQTLGMLLERDYMAWMPWPCCANCPGWAIRPNGESATGVLVKVLNRVAPCCRRCAPVS